MLFTCIAADILDRAAFTGDIAVNLLLASAPPVEAPEIANVFLLSISKKEGSCGKAVEGAHQHVNVQDL